MTRTPSYMTVSQVIDELSEINVGANAVRNWMRSGRIPRLRLPNGEYRVHRAVVDAIKAGEDPWQVHTDGEPGQVAVA
jgi:predicted site-specific integrase-resolvase